MSNLTPLQKATAQAIINIFETDKARGDYGNVTVIEGDTGHLTYGRSQTTLTSHLFELLKEYVAAPGAQFAEALSPYLDRLKAEDTSLDEDGVLHSLLRKAGSDPVMQKVQDAFFDRVYWQPAADAADKEGIYTPLGVAVVYDSIVQGSWATGGRVRDKTIAWTGKCSVIGEKAWIPAYVKTRRRWLANNRPDLQPTVYRMDAFQKLLDAGNWDLTLPLTVRGVRLTPEILGVRDVPIWTLLYHGKALGQAWTNEQDGDRAYYPARAFARAVLGENASLLGYLDGKLTLGAKPLTFQGEPVPTLLRPSGPNGETSAWSWVRALAVSLGMTVAADPEKHSITVAWP